MQPEKMAYRSSQLERVRDYLRQMRHLPIDSNHEQPRMSEDSDPAVEPRTNEFAVERGIPTRRFARPLGGLAAEQSISSARDSADKVTIS